MRLLPNARLLWVDWPILKFLFFSLLIIEYLCPRRRYLPSVSQFCYCSPCCFSMLLLLLCLEYNKKFPSSHPCSCKFLPTIHILSCLFYWVRLASWWTMPPYLTTWFKQHTTGNNLTYIHNQHHYYGQTPCGGVDFSTY